MLNKGKRVCIGKNISIHGVISNKLDKNELFNYLDLPQTVQLISV